MKKFQSSAALINQLKKILRRQRLVLFSAGVVAVAAALVAAWILLSMLASLMVLPVWFKLPLLVTVGLATIYLFGRYALTRLFNGDVDSVALALEEKNSSLKGRLIAAIQFSRMKSSGGFSSDLIAVTEQQALSEAAGLEFGEVISFNPLLRTARMLALSLALAVGLLFVAPGFFGYAFEVFSHPTTRIAPAIAYSLSANPGSTEWVKYRDIEIGGVLIGERFPEKAFIHHRLAGGNWQKTEIELTTLIHTIVADGDSVAFGIRLRQINRSFDYFVEAGDLETDVQKIDVVDRPRVMGIKLSVFYPEYTDLSPVTIDENNGSFSALVGSRFNMKLETNLPIEKAEIIFGDGTRTSLSVTGQSAEIARRVERSESYHFELTDHLGEKNPDPIEYYITAVPDEYPSVDVIRPGFDVNLNDEMILPLLIRIFDDYGFSSLVMKYSVVSQGRASAENVAVLHYSDRIKTEGDVEFNWDMDRLNLFPGDYVTYFFEVADNDNISGPKISQSRKYIARLPSLDEIISQIDQESTERVDKNEEMVRSAKELVQRLKNAARKLDSQNQKSRSGDWPQQKELESIAQKNEELVEQIDELTAKMDQSIEKMKDDALMSREVIAKLEEIRKLFEEVATPEMREAQKKLMEALEQMDRETMKEAMKDFQMTQEELLERLERTLALLKKMKVQEKMEAMIRRIEELVERQSQSNEQTESAKKDQLPALSPAEDDIKKSLEQLQKEVGDLNDLVKEAGLQDNPETQKFSEALEKSDAAQNMDQMSQNLKKSQKEGASKEGKKAMAKLLDMLDQMQQANMAMKQSDQKMTEQAMRRAINQTNQLSQSEEELIRQAQAMNPRSVAVRDVAAAQQDLAKACQGLSQTISKLGAASPFVAAELQSLVNKALQNMEMATKEFDSRNGHSATGKQRQAMVDLNKASTRLMESLDALKDCDNASNCPDGTSQLESMCKKQNKLNQETQGMCDNPGSYGQGQPMRPSDKMGEDGFKRLAGEQGAIRKSLQQLEAEFGGSRQILGRLSDIAVEMKKIEEDLANGEVGPETTERQLRVYSRMLEASRSLQRKDFSEQRRANSATEQTVFIPPALMQDLLNDDIKLEDRLRSFLGKGYPPQYEEQIKAYFKALLKTQGERSLPEPLAPIN